jgi:hypothetical protein
VGPCVLHGVSGEVVHVFYIECRERRSMCISWSVRGVGLCIFHGVLWESVHVYFMEGRGSGSMCISWGVGGVGPCVFHGVLGSGSMSTLDGEKTKCGKSFGAQGVGEELN